MDSLGQFSIFIKCVGIGFCGGVLYEILSILKFPWIKHKKIAKILQSIADGIFWFGFCIGSVWLSYTFEFPAFRVYIWIGYLVGGILYLKILHKIVAFFKKICYNEISKGIKRATDKDKTLKKRDG